ncbi:MAG TPA: magnesium-translocating P-type ATPase [Burkholderiales bacterium]|nr:magnesium-translocating P-type ATPase [Burkholderiales bacterium]
MREADPPRIERYWQLPAVELLARLGSGAQGLAEAEAAARLERYGANLLRQERALSALRVLAGQFRSPLVLILVFAAAVSLVVRDWLEASIILAIVAGSAALGAAQEYRASAAVRRLRARIALQTECLRGGAARPVAAAALVPGDVVLLAAGSLVPGDGVLLEAKDFFVNQALLTGESLPVEKQPGQSAAGAGLAGRANCVFMGTSVRSGTARALIVRTGRATEVGAIADSLRRRVPETDFERGLRQFGYLLTRVAAVMVVAVFAVNVLFHRPTLEALLFAIALAVGITPELLPAILSVTLARGARAMALRGVIVRRLNAIENLGSMDVLCTDKTGTLTEGVVRVELACDAAGSASPGVLRDAYLNAAFQTGLANPLDEAIVAAGRAAGIDAGAVKKLDEIPYDFMRKRLSVVVEDPAAGGAARLITKGAVEQVLEVCAGLDERRAAIEARFREWSAQGYRVIALAVRDLPRKEAYRREDEKDLALAGFLLCFDPPDAQTPRVLAELARAGVAVKIITGDNRYIAAHVADAVGLDGAALITGAQLDAMHDEALWRTAPATQVFAEVDPNQKERIIAALRRTGHVVGFLGDGINDAPALHAADVGISVERAADVAKETADIVLLEHDLAVLHDGVLQGRRTFANTVKYIFATTSGTFGNMLSMAAASLFLPFLPLLAKQILLNNFLSDLPAVFISGDRVDEAWLRKPYRWSIVSIRRFMVVFGVLSTVFDFVTFAALWWLIGGVPDLFRTGWFVESLLSQIAVLLVIRTTLPFWRSPPGAALGWAALGSALLALALPYLPYAGIFDFVPLPAPVLATVIGITAAYVLVTEFVKRVFYRFPTSGIPVPGPRAPSRPA